MDDDDNAHACSRKLARIDAVPPTHTSPATAHAAHALRHPQARFFPPAQCMWCDAGGCWGGAERTASSVSTLDMLMCKPAAELNPIHCSLQALASRVVSCCLLRCSWTCRRPAICMGPSVQNRRERCRLDACREQQWLFHHNLYGCTPRSARIDVLRGRSTHATMGI